MYVYSTGTTTWTAISSTSAVTNVQGTSGNITSSGGSTPVINLATAGTAGTYTFPSSLTTDAYGRVTSITSATNTGTGNNVLQTSPTLTTPNIGAATGTSLTATGTVTGNAVAATGLTGATTNTVRLVGATSAGAPTSGTFAVGDLVIDDTGTLWICTTAGTPGTWVPEISASLTVRSATATAGTGEFTIYGTSGTASQTITLPATALNGSIYQIKNISPYPVNIKGGTSSVSISGTVYSASTSYTVPVNTYYSFVYSGSIWYCFGTTDLAQMGGSLTAPTLNNSTLTGTLTASSTSGTSGQLLQSTGTGVQWTSSASSLTLTAPILTMSINAQTGTTYTPIASDAGSLITLNNASAISVTIPTNASVGYAIGSQLNFAWITGAGQPTISAVNSGTTTIISTGATSNSPKLRAVNSTATAIKLATDTWLIMGDIV